MPNKIIHIADAHLGKSAFAKTTESGSNLRETLIYENRIAAIEQIIKEKPIAIVDAGDWFDTVKPKTKAYSVTLDCIDLLESSGIPIMMISGNHDMPKTMYTTSPFEIIARKSIVHATHSLKYERVEIQDVMFHLIPNMLNTSDYMKEYKKLELDNNRANILVTHGLTSNLLDKRLSEVAECNLDDEIVNDEKIMYKALGHIHNQQCVNSSNAWYAGSAEYLTYGEISDVKGGLILNSGNGKVEHMELPHTPMFDLGVINASVLDRESITDIILNKANRLPENSMAQITLDFAESRITSIDSDVLSDTRDRLLDLKIKITSVEAKRICDNKIDIKSVDYIKTFDTFMQQQTMTDAQKASVGSIGSDILKTAISQHTDVYE
jgi:DNA repair exonuclease SbcCD nuclease subunit